MAVSCSGGCHRACAGVWECRRLADLHVTRAVLEAEACEAGVHVACAVAAVQASRTRADAARHDSTPHERHGEQSARST